MLRMSPLSEVFNVCVLLRCFREREYVHMYLRIASHVRNSAARHQRSQDLGQPDFLGVVGRIFELPKIIGRVSDSRLNTFHLVRQGPGQFLSCSEGILADEYIVRAVET